MLFHLGVLWRLHEVNYLQKIERISSVSGGSIAAAVLGLKWSNLFLKETDPQQQFITQVVAPIRKLAGQTIDVSSIIEGVLEPGSISDQVIETYRKHLFGTATLQDLPDKPRFVINATNVQSGALWRFMKPYMRDYRVGEVKNPTIELAVAVAASSAFPPFLSPLILHLNAADYTPHSGLDLQFEPFTTRVVLTDGAVYDNLGLEAVWKRYDTILVSDAGGHLKAEATPKLDWPRHTYRVINIIDNQVRALRTRIIIDAFEQRRRLLADGVRPDDETLRLTTRHGAYWGIRSDIAGYGLADALPCPLDKTIELAHIATRLKGLAPEIQEHLINWGYAICDAALRKNVDSTLPVPNSFPYPSGIG